MQNKDVLVANDAISIKDTLYFIIQNKKLIIFCSLTGLLFASVYLLLLPKLFEATWQIQMATGSEDPVVLMVRLRTPTTYPAGVQHRCDMPDGEWEDYLGGKLKVTVDKKLPNTLSMKLYDGSLDQVKNCSEALVAMIVEQQRNLIEEKLVGTKEMFQINQQRLQREMKLFEDLKRNDNGSLKYLAKLEYINSLNARIDALQEEILSSQLHPAKLISPIYVPNKPLTPKTGLWLIFGAGLGLMLGLLYALGRDWWRKAA